MAYFLITLIFKKMKIHLETPRLLMRDIELSDVDDMFEMDSDPEVHKYLGNQPQQNKAEAEKVIQFLQK
ncbi:MAG: GNAT family N-acetyltransferase, partial [Saprospiraceae bacterium]|nr:GNAT family N-acetyltransferase [Saprospiraceae bacterium]